jgi:hypothetical protein
MCLRAFLFTAEAQRTLRKPNRKLCELRDSAVRKCINTSGVDHPSGGKAKGTEALLCRFRAFVLIVADTTYFRGALGFRLDLVLRGLGKG